MRLSEAASVLDAPLEGRDAGFFGVTTDSRCLSRGALFVALRGPTFDGQDFIDHAAQRGAAGALVTDSGSQSGLGHRMLPEATAPSLGLPILRVSNTHVALIELAGHWRGRFSPRVVSVTGSNGKTTVKEMLAAILRLQGPVLATKGNLNNEIGVPLTLLDMDFLHQAAVIEIGANHRGEVGRLSRLIVPQIGLITQCAPAHLEGFGSVEGVARAKGELIESLPDDGIAIVNADDPYCQMWRELAGSRDCLTFGRSANADVTPVWSAAGHGGNVVLETPAGRARLRLTLPGRHNAMNAAAAGAAAIAAGVALDVVAAGLESMQPVSGRLQVTQVKPGLTLIDDSYNANPVSLRAGLEVLADYRSPRWLVLGDMAELGPGAVAYHRDAGRLARELGVDHVCTTGELSAATAAAFGRGGEHFDSRANLINALRAQLLHCPAGIGAGLHSPNATSATVLVKGSRSMAMEHVVAALTGEA